MVSLVVSCLLAVAAGQAAPAAPAAGQAEERRKLEEQIAKELGAPSAAVAPAAPAPEPAAQGAKGGNPLGRLLLLPDISANGSAALVYDSPGTAGAVPPSGPVGYPGKVTPVFEELELALQAVVDPYARADVFLAFSPEGVEVEEAYVTTLSLPWGLQVRAGTLRSFFGRLNLQHPHVQDFADQPLSFTRLVAADALKGPGLDLSWLAPLPWFAELHVAWQETRPAGSTIPQLTPLARLVQYLELSDSATLGFGLSAALFDGQGPDPRRDLAGADLHLKLRPPAGRAYVDVQGEIFGSWLSGEPAGQGEAGGYVEAVWRPSAYWDVGARYDQAPAGAGEAVRRYSALGTWFPSEFMRLRLQATLDDLPGGTLGFEGILALGFSIGVHGAHPF